MFTTPLYLFVRPASYLLSGSLSEVTVVSPVSEIWAWLMCDSLHPRGVWLIHVLYFSRQDAKVSSFRARRHDSLSPLIIFFSTPSLAGLARLKPSLLLASFSDMFVELGASETVS